VRNHLKTIVALALIASLIIAGVVRRPYLVIATPITIGVLHSLTGTMAVNKKPLVDADSRHLWKMMRIGKVRGDGQFDQVFVSAAPLRPTPWPSYRSRDSWQTLLAGGRP
jgi:hypothetical protein